MTGPAMHASVERTFHRLLRRLPDPFQQQLAALTPAEHLCAAYEPSVFGWVPFSHVVGLRDSILRIVGSDDDYVALIQQLGVLAIDLPPFGALSKTLFRIYDRTPAALLRANARVWDTIFRGVGVYRVQSTDDDAALVVIEGSCPDAREPAFRLYMLGVLMAVIELGGGVSPTGLQTLSAGRIELRVRWQHASAQTRYDVGPWTRSSSTT